MFEWMSKGSIYTLQKIMMWADPSWWGWVSLCLFVLCMIHFLPLELKPENHDVSDRVFMYARRGFLLILVSLGLIFPLLFYVSFGAATPSVDRQEVSHLVIQWYLDMAGRYWGLPLAAIISGVTANFCWHRYGEPYWSRTKRKYRVKQAEDAESDIRTEQGKYTTKKYNPEDYFKDGFYFLGLDENNSPIYVADDTFHSTHKKGLAPTGFGKGVMFGVVLTQAVRKGNTTICVDPKEDQRLPYILQNEAKRAGRPFIYLDLNPEGKGNWHPFKGGSLRDRRARLLQTFGLTAGGTNADVYKSKERAIADKAFSETDGSIVAMLEAVRAQTDKDGLSQLRDSLAEWAQVKTFTANRKKKGHSIEASLLNNAVVYVKGSLTDNVVKSATRAYIAEVIQESRRLLHQRTSQITMAVDELRFLISPEIVDALATSREFRLDMLLATQAVSDLRNLEDKTIDGAALQKSVEINCQIKLLYRAGDMDTAEWGEGLAGTKMIRVAGMERTEVNRWGAEVWEKVRSFNNKEVPLIHRNVFLALPPMVCVVFQPSALPKVNFSSWLNVDRSFCSWQTKDLDEPEVDADDAGRVENVEPGTSTGDMPAGVTQPAAKIEATGPAQAPVSKPTHTTVSKATSSSALKNPQPPAKAGGNSAKPSGATVVRVVQKQPAKGGTAISAPTSKMRGNPKLAKPAEQSSSDENASAPVGAAPAVPAQPAELHPTPCPVAVGIVEDVQAQATARLEIASASAGQVLLPDDDEGSPHLTDTVEAENAGHAEPAAADVVDDLAAALEAKE